MEIKKYFPTRFCVLLTGRRRDAETRRQKYTFKSHFGYTIGVPGGYFKY
jgi:hypothetical protein